jgi:hypothetical protein
MKLLGVLLVVAVWTLCLPATLANTLSSQWTAAIFCINGAVAFSLWGAYAARWYYRRQPEQAFVLLNVILSLLACSLGFGVSVAAMSSDPVSVSDWAMIVFLLSVAFAVGWFVRAMVSLLRATYTTTRMWRFLKADKPFGMPKIVVAEAHPTSGTALPPTDPPKPKRTPPPAKPSARPAKDADLPSLMSEDPDATNISLDDSG